SRRRKRRPPRPNEGRIGAAMLAPQKARFYRYGCNSLATCPLFPLTTPILDCGGHSVLVPFLHGRGDRTPHQPTTRDDMICLGLNRFAPKSLAAAGLLLGLTLTALAPV